MYDGNKGVVSRVGDDTKHSLEDSIIDLVDDGSLSETERRILKSKISFVDDDRMPYYIHNGNKIYADVLMNSSGAVRRQVWLIS